MDKEQFSKPYDLRSVEVKDDFWKSEMELVRKEVIPYQWNALNNNIPGATPSFCMHNYKVAGKLNEARMKYGKDYGKEKELPFFWGNFPKEGEEAGDKFYGFVFQDSDFSKWIEAVAYSLTQHPDKELEATADEAIDIVCRAQLENGYLDTFYIISDFDKAFTNLRDAHELYCFGHLTEGAVAYYEATGKDKLLNAAKRYADYIDSKMGPEDGKMHGYPGHEIAEMALIRLYEATKDKKYLKLSKYFVDERGKAPFYFDSEEGRKPDPAHPDYYHQAHMPVREQDEAVGHAVRAVYLYSGMADVARLTGDEELFKACERLFDNITKKRMYVTGGIGSTHIGEAFTFDYDLPNDTAYSETCAAIGLVFFCRRMLEISADRKYSDVMERAVYNGVLSGMALDGKSFFYVNPLEVNPEACKRDARKEHVKHVRQKWFGCACCPPNIARLVSSIPAYAYTENEKILYMHLYIGGEISKKYEAGEVKFAVESGFPWNGNVKITASCAGTVKGTLALRVPDWCKNKVELTGAVEKNGYLYLEKEWKTGDEIALNFEMNPIVLMANTNVREDSGKLCVTRGPLVYCLEEIDNGKNLQNLLLEADKPINVSSIEIGGRKMNSLIASGLRVKDSPSDAALYTEYKPVEADPVTLTLVPYFAWNNRGEGEMTVWM